MPLINSNNFFLFCPSMDILKKAFNNLSACTIDTDSVNVCGRSCKNIEVEFPRKKTTTYNIQTVLFYLLNKERQVEDYIKLCQLNKIQIVRYVDQKSIIEDIQNFQTSGFDGHFIMPVFTNNRHYTIYDRGRHTIIVLGNTLATINSSNFCQLFGVSDGCSESKRGMVFEKNGSTYTVCDSVENFTDKDWKCVKCLFVDEEDNNLLMMYNEQVEKLKRKRKIFSANKKVFGELVVFKNGEIENLDEIWNKIECLD